MLSRVFPAMLLLFACKRQEGNIVLDGQGNAGQMQLFTTDTLSLSAVTVQEDSLPGNNIRYVLLGSMNDPLIGTISPGHTHSVVYWNPPQTSPTPKNRTQPFYLFPLLTDLIFTGINKPIWDFLSFR